MYRFEVCGSLFQRDVTAQVFVLPQGLHVSLYGGELPHIGAVSIVRPDGKIHTEQFPGHKDGVISRTWAEKLWEAGYAPVVVEAGIHYDQLSHEGIIQVLRLADEMLNHVTEKLNMFELGNR